MNTITPADEGFAAARKENARRARDVRLTTTMRVADRKEMQKAYAESKKEAMTLVKRIERAIVNEPVAGRHWGHVGDMQSLVKELKAISDRLYDEGEYAQA